MSNDTIPETVGTATFIVNDKTYHTWYKVIGDLKSGQTPLVTLHGGPGLNHIYMLIHKRLWTIAKIPIVCYDQLGNGESTHIGDAPIEFWKPELFMDELENLVQHLGISDNYSLVGHSWGDKRPLSKASTSISDRRHCTGMLGAQLAAARRPKGLRRLIIDNSPASMPLLVEGINALLDERFPPDFVAMLRKHETEGTTDSQEYQDGIWVFLKKHVCTLDPWPEPVMDSFKAQEEDTTVYHTMLGPSEFCITGTLKEWNIINILHQIRCETLVSAKEDEVREVAQLPYFLNVPKIKWVELAHSTHLALYEEERYIRIVTSFLTA